MNYSFNEYKKNEDADQRKKEVNNNLKKCLGYRIILEKRYNLNSF